MAGWMDSGGKWQPGGWNHEAFSPAEGGHPATEAEQNHPLLSETVLSIITMIIITACRYTHAK